MTFSLKRVVFLTPDSPFPPTDGWKIRESHIIRLLKEKMPLELLCTRGLPGSRFTGLPFLAASNPVMAALKSRANADTLLWVSRMDLALHIPKARALGFGAVVFDPQDTGQVKNRSLKRCTEAHRLVASSEVEAARLARVADGVPIHVIPNTVDFAAYESVRGAPGSTLFFHGTLDFEPNVEGLRWFVAEVLPRLRVCMGARMPKIVVAGSRPAIDLQNLLAREGIELHANPPSMLSFLSDAALVFVPTQTSPGTGLKVLEAMAAGRPIISTVKGVEGLSFSPTYDIWIAEGPDRFTSAIKMLLEDPERRLQVGSNAARTVQAHFDHACARAQVETLLSGLSGT